MAESTNLAQEEPQALPTDIGCGLEGEASGCSPVGLDSIADFTNGTVRSARASSGESGEAVTPPPADADADEDFEDFTPYGVVQSPEPAKNSLSSLLSSRLTEKVAGVDETWSYFKTSWNSKVLPYMQEAKSETSAKMNSKVQEALPKIRDIRHKTQEWSLAAKEQYLEKRQNFVNQVVSGLELDEEERAAASTAAASSSSAGVETKRWWSEACKASQKTHDLTNDPPAPPQRASPQSSASPDSPGDLGSDAGRCPFRGCLEVEVLGFSTAPPISRPDGSPAVHPVCQAAVGSRYTGALLPRTAYAANGSPTMSRKPSGEAPAGSDLAEIAKDTAEETPVIDSATPEEAVPAVLGISEQALASASEEANSTARFVIDEIMGCDLRLHVFDSKYHQFSMGFEESAFCGGAILPLNVLLRRGAKRTLCVQGFRHQEITDEFDVQLLPIEVVRMVRKLKLPDPLLERPPADFGHVSLRLTLTLYDMVPARLYMAQPFKSDASEATSINDFGRVDEPMSVLKAVANAVVRFKKALGVELWMETFDILREAPLSSATLHVLWAYGLLVAPVWKLPAILLVVVAMAVFQVSSLGTEARQKEPPHLYKDEAPSEDSTLTLRERTKNNIASAIQVELGIMRFAQTLTEYSVFLEKLRFLVMLRDPYLSILCGSFILSTMVSTTIGIGVFLAIFGSFGPCLLLWMYGCFFLLPTYGRAKVNELFEWGEEISVRYFGHGKLQPTLESFWARIPDDNEAQHCDLFDRYCMVR